MRLAEGGLGCLALKNAIAIFSILDIVIGVLASIELFALFMEWEYYTMDGTLYFLTTLYIIKPFSIALGMIGLVGAMQLNQ